MIIIIFKSNKQILLKVLSSDCIKINKDMSFKKNIFILIFFIKIILIDY